MKKHLLLIFVSCLFGIHAMAQDTQSSYPVSNYKPLKIDITDDVYVRFIIWHQQWLVTNNLESDDKLRLSSFARRSRFLAYAQISPRFLILTHWGLNNLSAQANLTSLGNNGDGPQLFLHDAWTEFKVSNNDALYIGTGLHYWKGLTRLASASTLNFMTLDQARPFTQWHSLGVTDQFARHFGVYAKGQIGQFDYKLAFNNPLNPDASLGGGRNYATSFPNATPSNLTYNGRNNTDSGGNIVGNAIVEGYFRYNFFDTESTKLPYAVGTYFGNKKVFGIGAGFFSHANGTYDTTALRHEDVLHLAIDVYYDAPLGNGAINAYVSFVNFDYGNNYVSRWGGTGTNVYGQLGYLFRSVNLMPYIAAQSGSYDALRDNISSFDFGVNYYVDGHNAKITLEYHTQRNDFREGSAVNGDISQLRLQTHIFL